jgi:hypothetical protein
MARAAKVAARVLLENAGVEVGDTGVAKTGVAKKRGFKSAASARAAVITREGG